MFFKIIKKFSKYKLAQYIGLWWTYIRVRYWIRICNNPLKLSILYAMEDMAVLGLQRVGWGHPKSRIGNNKLPDLDQIREAARLERKP